MATAKGECCTVSFIETLDASSLSLTQEQFDYLMQQKRPELMSSLASQQATLQQIQCNKKLLEALIHRQDRLMEKAVSLERELVAWPLSVQVEVQEIIRRIPLETLRTSSQNKQP